MLLEFTLLDVDVHPSLEGGQGSQKDKAAYQQSPEISLEKFPGIKDPTLRACIDKHLPRRVKRNQTTPITPVKKR